MSIRDNLLVTIGSRAAYMHTAGVIELPEGISGEEFIAHFAVKLADDWMNTDGEKDMTFDEYIESAISDRFKKVLREEKKLSKTEEAIRKVPHECVGTIDTYAELLHHAIENGKEMQKEEFHKKLRGYLKCLVDLGRMTMLDLRAIHMWIATGHKIREKKEN